MWHCCRCAAWSSLTTVLSAGMLESRAQEVAAALTGVEQRSNERDEQSRCVALPAWRMAALFLRALGIATAAVKFV